MSYSLFIYSLYNVCLYHFKTNVLVIYLGNLVSFKYAWYEEEKDNSGIIPLNIAGGSELL